MIRGIHTCTRRRVDARTHTHTHTLAICMSDEMVYLWWAFAPRMESLKPGERELEARRERA